MIFFLLYSENSYFSKKNRKISVFLKMQFIKFAVRS